MPTNAVQQPFRTLRCGGCDQDRGGEDLVSVGSDELRCLDCLDRAYVSCSGCGVLSVYTRGLRRHNGRAYCRRCHEENFRLCIHCDTSFHTSDMISDSQNEYIAISHMDDFIVCANSGRFSSRSEAVERDGQWYHPLFVPVIHRIQKHNYRPEPIFHKAGDDGPNTRLFFGVELEIEGGGETHVHCDQILTIPNPSDKPPEHVAYGKHDGSVDRGFEIVTHPASYNYHIQTFPWDEMLAECKRLGYRRNPNTCGLHVHISKNFFGQSELRQDLGVMKLLFLVERFWDYLLTFSRRTEEQLERWASRYGMQETPRKLLEYAKHQNSSSRYKAVNLANDHTVEIRLFRGTLEPHIIKATIQLCRVLSEISKGVRLEDVIKMTWKDVVKRGERYPELVRYLGERGIYVSQ